MADYNLWPTSGLLINGNLKSAFYKIAEVFELFDDGWQTMYGVKNKK